MTTPLVTEPAVRHLLEECRDAIEELLAVYEDLDSDAETIAEHVASNGETWRGLRQQLNATLRARVGP